MSILSFTLGLVVGLGIGRTVWRPFDGLRVKSNLEAANAAVHRRKEEAKQKIMGLFAGRAEIANDDAEKLLGISDATASNYLSELEADGKLVQIGVAGRPVRYRQNSPT